MAEPIVPPRDVEAMLMRVLRLRKPQLQRLLFNTWNANREDIKLEEIAKVFGTVPGDMWDPGGAFGLWQARYNEVVADKWTEQWFGAADSASSLMTRGLNGLVDVGPDLLDRYEFSLQGHMDLWVNQHAAQFVTSINDTERRSLRSLIRVNTTHPDGARLGGTNLGRLVRASIGLTPRQAAGVHNEHIALLEDGVPEQRALEISNRTSNRRRAQRAELIGRTELAFAYNAGTDNSITAAVDQGLLAGFTLLKRWWTQLDERVCPICGPLHDQEVGIKQQFESEKVSKVLFVPPAHPACRCVVLYEPTEIEE